VVHDMHNMMRLLSGWTLQASAYREYAEVLHGPLLHTQRTPLDYPDSFCALDQDQEG
jgi:hypothetical protein